MVAILAKYAVMAMGVMGADAKPKPAPKPKTPTAGSHKCQKGLFDSLAKDGAVPLCDEHYPNEKAKSSWAIAFYDKEKTGLKDALNRVAIDLGNEPPEKSKAQKKPPKKQRARIKNLAEKYEFEAEIPKKGLEEKGKEPLLKVGAVCCDCAAEVQQSCVSRERGIRLVRPGMKEVAMSGDFDDAYSPEKVVRFLMGELGFVKGAEPTEAEGAKRADSPKATEFSEESLAAKKKQLKDLIETKTKATADEDYQLAKKIKSEIDSLESSIKIIEKQRKQPEGSAEKKEKPGKKTDSNEEKLASKRKLLQELIVKKTKAAEDEDYKLAKQLKTEIDAVESTIKSIEKVSSKLGGEL